MTSGHCDPGYYCIQMAVVSNPSDGNVTGDICPMGAHCPAGSTAPLLCQAGTYQNSTGNEVDTDCVTCVAGSYCSGSGNSIPDGLCSSGYYCPSGQDNPTPASYNCTQGHYCPEGSITPLRCASGSYQDDIGSWWCKACPAGYFCDSTMDPVVLFNSSHCPTGFYCPENTTMSTEFPCPAGTFNNITHRTVVSDCTPCSGGMYCDQVGLTIPVADCAAGYFCLTGANSSTPSQGADADICPPRFYCPLGTVSPVCCSLGTFNPTTGRQAIDECTNCTGGTYCPDYNMTATGPACQAGYFCPSKVDVAQFILCPEGSYCPLGSDQPIPCAAGSFSNVTGLTAQSECTNCTDGFYCPTAGMTETTLQCWGGYYCPTGMAVPNPGAYICPMGMHCPNGSEIYKECPDGFYTNYTGASSCDVCPAGFYCLPVQPYNDTLNAQDCPNGYYCPAGTGINWMSCPSGSYSDQSGLYQVDQCKACTAGMYCQGEHLTVPTANCSAGYYCSSGVDRPQPGASNDSVAANCTCPDQAFYTGVGGICPLGHYCPEGSATPTACAAGTYAKSTGLAECAGCLEGYYCLVNASEYLTSPCPAGHYCPNGTAFSMQYRCPPGTYNPNTLGTALADCRDCDAGQYCQDYAGIAPTGNCSAGWYCVSGSDSANTTTHGGICQPGYYRL
ncbi:multiple epidermal growth factor-like domains protein 6 [Argopecten irradians]|uniref:multiple epidermal growth factor-like domains protein 6 n=1 Tax=Argopecten irradians TaxID=31199 RepID=UPI003716E132